MFPEHKLTRADLICSEQNSGRAARESNTYKSTDTQKPHLVCAHMAKKNLQLVPRQKHVIRGHRQGEMSAQ